MTIAAVLAAFAQHVEEASVASVHFVRATSPVRGSAMWCKSSPPRGQLRTFVPELASPPPRSATTSPTSAAEVRESKSMPTCHPPLGASPVIAMSPPKLTSTPQDSCAAIHRAARSAANAFAEEPRSIRTSGGMRTLRFTSSNSIARQPGAGSTGSHSGRDRLGR
jgi:hypothetical protein